MAYLLLSDLANWQFSRIFAVPRNSLDNRHNGRSSVKPLSRLATFSHGRFDT